jgi:hypothetical protein
VTADLEPSAYMRLLGAVDRRVGRYSDGRSEASQVWLSTYATLWAGLGYTILVGVLVGVAIVRFAWRAALVVLRVAWHLVHRGPRARVVRRVPSRTSFLR